MKILIQKSKLIFILVLIVSLAVSIFYLRNKVVLTSITLIVTSACIAIALTTQKYWKSYQLAEYTREKMLRTLLLDLLGLLCAMAAALYAGWLAGGYFGLHVGFWLGLLAGFLGGFSAAWAVRWAWGILVKVEA